ncbi:MAG: HAD hydrolase family protein [Candidatus Levybacteria bacterium]|nr:HAD hydrolase family protein [Candidatus Levybacteria bacterium]
MTGKIVKTAWVFDADGVIVDLSEKKTESKILDFIAGRLKLEEPVAFNTGRSVAWMIDQVINPLLARIKDKRILRRLFVSGEKGGAWFTINTDGSKNIQIDESLRISDSLHEKIQNFIAETSPEALGEYEKKLTMISFEMTTGFSYEKFKIIQKKLTQEINELVKRTGLRDDLRVDPTRAAIDIENQRVGKGFAMGIILQWMKEMELTPQKIITFGDSKSDFEMAQKAYKKGFQTEFVYVGGDTTFKNIKTEIPIIIPKSKFEKGTLEFLQTL